MPRERDSYIFDTKIILFKNVGGNKIPHQVMIEQHAHA